MNNTDSFIQEEIDMQHTKTTQDVQDTQKMVNITERETVVKLTDTAAVATVKPDLDESMSKNTIAVVASRNETALVNSVHENNASMVTSEIAGMEMVVQTTNSAVENVSEEILPEATAKNSDTDKKIIDQVGHLTRNLHDSLRELGYDKRLESLVSEVPEAQDKLTYIAAKTEQAADRTLNATEIAMPIQEKLSLEATQLSEKWKYAFEEQRVQPDTEKFKLLLIETLSYIDQVPEQAEATNAQLMEIMMAQDFQDLTGQVIKKVTHMVQRLEYDLVQLLVANVHHENRQTFSNTQITEGTSLMNGPVINPEKNPDTVSNQDQVDDLLASLGF
ncbi:protein phosphatase CheZ [Nitrosomonas sp.]|uniref:protein phosphatase CheZ n=1 Tax=Nitrosomonas sp. TaxID=42353 RepID=UPI00207F8DDF|nr:protein phosphatase CheZ [Nitrosomonas sp.]GJL76905.1 MAG: hypothetical protein NMNS02_30110 [Nitrosomonas sp.]